MAYRVDDARHWRTRADEARELAAQMANPDAKRIMLGIAISYVALAKMATERDAAKRKH
jgi:plasmid stability protein